MSSSETNTNLPHGVQSWNSALLGSPPDLKRMSWSAQIRWLQECRSRCNAQQISLLFTPMSSSFVLELSWGSGSSCAFEIPPAQTSTPSQPSDTTPADVGPEAA